MSSNPCGDGETIKGTLAYPTKPIIKKAATSPRQNQNLARQQFQISREYVKKINTAAADNQINMPPDADSSVVNSVIIDLSQGHDMTNTIETSE